LDAKNITHGRFVSASLVADKGIIIARSKAITGTPSGTTTTGSRFSA
jgi:hypothetical protein